jgi:hypothetical protein
MGRVLIAEDDLLIALEISQFVEGVGYIVGSGNIRGCNNKGFNAA